MLIWILVILALLGTILNVRKDRLGFLFWAISNLGLAIVTALAGQWAQTTLWATYLVLAVWGWLAWKNPASCVCCPAVGTGRCATCVCDECPACDLFTKGE